MPMQTLNPATGDVEKVFTEHTAEDVDRRIGEAHAAHLALKDTDFATRASWMLKAADLVEEDVDRLAEIMTREMGKPIVQARAEALKCAKNMRYYAHNAESFMADEPLADPSVVGASSAYVRYEPLGVILAVMPWNFPLWQVVRFAAPALMAGNTGVLKHASNVPQAAEYLDTIFERGGFPKGSLANVFAPVPLVNQIIDDWRVKAVTLTGSEPAGRAVAERAGRQIKKAVLELGGSDPFIVMPSADIEAAASMAVTARMINNGQSCIAGKRFLIHADVYDDFVGRFVAKVEALKVGDPLEEDTNIGPLATANGVRDIRELVDDAVELGARLLTGGHVIDRPGFYYAPTIIDNLKAPMRLVMEEAFGPVASVYRFETREEAVEISNQVTFGLGSVVWTTDQSDEDFFIPRLDSGAVTINGMTVSYPELPFGGVKDSGYGRELGAHGLLEFTNAKTIWKA
jgi:succinate-semialdehyde dehydrogenase / glutarate-semialdehyde dehydrogenase